MPKLLGSISNDEQVLTIPGTTFTFSGVRPEKLGAEYQTLVTLVIDITGSVSPFADDLLKMLKTVVNACQKHPRSENLMVRIVTFNEDLYELHGFKQVADVDLNSYQTFNCGGMTALFDACVYAIGATQTYAETLRSSDYKVNAAIYILTDGDDNRSTNTLNKVKRCLLDTRSKEDLESLVTILIGVNAGSCTQYLQDFKDKAGLSQYVDVADATPGKLAKLAQFISQSVSSTSQSLGSGGPSQLINPTF